jgi:bleomycin hydrolase
MNIRYCISLYFIITSGNAFSQTLVTNYTLPKIKITDSVYYAEIENQFNTSTCWTFCTNGLFESDLKKRLGITINLSEMFYVRHAYIDKAAQYLATKGKTYFEGGGQFHDVIRVIEKYGIIPENVYAGKLAKAKEHNHTTLDKEMLALVKQFLKAGKTKLSAQDLKLLNSILDKHLGKVPATFVFNGKRFTPKSFAQNILQFKNDYIEIVSFSDKPLYKKFMLADKYNWAYDSFYNVRLDELKMILDTAIAKGWSVEWEGDVTENGFSFYSNYAIADSLPNNIDEQRLINYANETTERDHGMQIISIGKDSIGNTWYGLKNSWGKTSYSNGIWYMNETYFKWKTVTLIVHKEGLPVHLARKLNLY